MFNISLIITDNISRSSHSHDINKLNIKTMKVNTGERVRGAGFQELGSHSSVLTGSVSIKYVSLFAKTEGETSDDDECVL